MLGVTIAALTGSDSAPAKANEAKQKNDIGAARDQVYLFASNAQTEAYERIYVKGKQATSDADVTAGNASKNVSDYVKTILKNEYPEDGTKKVGLATIVASTDGGTITISTTDFEETGTISETGGTLTWSGITSNNGTSQVTPTPGATSYTITYNANGGTGTMETTTAVVANTFTREGYTFVKWNTETDGSGTDYAVSATPNSDITLYAIWVKNKVIGDSVSYSTTLNGKTLNNWKVFYVDGDYTYLIYGDYLLNAAVNTSNLSGLATDGIYSVCAQEQAGRTELLNAMSTKLKWESLLTGSINGHDVNETTTDDIWAMGSPDLELWINSWNTNQTYITLNYTGDLANPSSNQIDLSNETGYENTLYFPYKENAETTSDCWGYWLASSHTSNTDSLVTVCFDGGIGHNWAGSHDNHAFRPVIKLPSSIVNQ